LSARDAGQNHFLTIYDVKASMLMDWGEYR
jgi:hypothetical protein